MRTIVTVILTSVLIAGCGTLLSYTKYRECTKNCEIMTDNSEKQRCESDCYAKFDWSDSPLGDPAKDYKKKRKEIAHPPTGCPPGFPPNRIPVLSPFAPL